LSENGEAQIPNLLNKSGILLFTNNLGLLYIAVLAWVQYTFDLTFIPLSYEERGFESYSPTLEGKGLGVRFVFHAIGNRYR
jgi:hypothetical protein